MSFSSSKLFTSNWINVQLLTLCVFCSVIKFWLKPQRKHEKYEHSFWWLMSQQHNNQKTFNIFSVWYSSTIILLTAYLSNLSMALISESDKAWDYFFPPLLVMQPCRIEANKWRKQKNQLFSGRLQNVLLQVASNIY